MSYGVATNEIGQETQDEVSRDQVYPAKPQRILGHENARFE